MSHILVVEDDPDIAALIAHYLEKAGHRVDRRHLGRGRAARGCGKPRPISSILDLMLPGMDGLLVCQAMRADPAIGGDPRSSCSRHAARKPIACRGLELGADDYVTKPFSPKELDGARRGAAAPRGRGTRTAGAPLRYGPITIDADRHTVALDGRGRPADREGVPAAAVPGAAQGPRPVARPAAHRRLGLPLHRRHTHGRRPHPPPAREAAAAHRRRSRRSSSSATSSIDRP